MGNELPYLLFAGFVLVLHVAVVVFVIAGLLFIFIGNLRDWHWVNALLFRLAHLAAILFVMAEAWLGIVCPLTTLEMWLRTQAGAATYSGGFIRHWLQELLYYDLPSWIFVVGYTVFFLLVAVAWIYFPPGKRYRK